MSRPTISRAISTGCNSEALRVAMSLPSRNTVMRSAIARNFRQAMRDIENGYALVAQVADDFEQRFGFEGCQRGCWLIEDDNAVRHLQRASDLHKLAARNGKTRNLCCRIDIGSKASHGFS